MKTWKTISLLIFALVNLCNISYAQDDVTKFLGIPVDGYKPEMIKNSKKKGLHMTKQTTSLKVSLMVKMCILLYLLIIIKCGAF